MTQSAPLAMTLMSTRARLVGLLLGAAALLSACADIEARLEPPPINPSSPIAPFAARVSAQTFAPPTFRQLPAQVLDTPPPSAYKAKIAREVHERRAMLAYWAQHPPEHGDTEGWAAVERSRIPKVEALPVQSTHNADSEAFARRERQEAVRPQ